MFYSINLIFLMALISISTYAKNPTNLDLKMRTINFGVVTNNSTYKIYRSSKLGAVGLMTLAHILQRKKLPFPKTIISMNDEGYGSKGTYAIEEYKEASLRGYTYFHSYGPDGERTYLDGASPLLKTLEDIDAKEKLNAEAVSLFGQRSDGKVEGGIDTFERILKIILDPKNQPVLFHCHGGRHRTGMVAMAIHKITAEAQKIPATPIEYLNFRYGIPLIDTIELDYRKYAGAGLYGPVLPRKENILFMRDFDVRNDLFNELVQKYRPALN